MTAQTGAHLIHLNDWTGFYVNGKLVYEHHDVPMEVIIDSLNLDMEDRWAEGTKLDEWVLEEGGFPKTLEEAQKIGYLR